MPPAARITDPTTHGAPLAPGPGSPNVLIGNLPAWRTIIDQHACPAASVSGADGIGSVLMGSPTVFINNQMACRQFDIVVEKPGLAMGPVNPIIMGEPTVIIGEMGMGSVGAPAVPGAPTPSTTLDAWQEAHKDEINEALKKQAEMLAAKKKALERWNAQDKADFKKWFGTTTEDARNKIKDRIDKELALNSKTTAANFKPAAVDDSDCYAYVHPDDASHTIYLGDDWKTASATGKDSKPGTLSHEMSHFDDVGGTKDHQYGAENCKQLAKDDSDLALDNADSFEYYMEGAK